MPSGDYAAIGGGALKLKGAKVQKTKKKKRKDKSDLEKNLSGGETSEVVKTNTETTPADAQDAHPSQRNSNNDDDDDEEAPELRKTEAERRYEEVKRKRNKSMPRAATPTARTSFEQPRDSGAAFCNLGSELEVGFSVGTTATHEVEVIVRVPPFGKTVV
ncbi:hypothetical protein E4U54_004277 [Claviceps lovelessii]|nr:hypothetical protein E4U54_004277 [Claviceps lovelessii]